MPVPSLVVSLGDALLLVVAHEVYVHTGLHCGPKLIEYSSNPCDVSIIDGRFRPIRQEIHDERSAAIAERRFAGGDLRGGATKPSHVVAFNPFRRAADRFSSTMSRLRT